MRVIEYIMYIACDVYMWCDVCGVFAVERVPSLTLLLYHTVTAGVGSCSGYTLETERSSAVGSAVRGSVLSASHNIVPLS